MNAKNLRLVAAKLARSRSYDQTRWLHPCGTPACIAGYAAACSLKRGESLHSGRLPSDAWVKTARGGRSRIAKRAAAFMGLSPNNRRAIFTPWPGQLLNGWPEPWRTEWKAANGDALAEKRIAVRYLRHLADEADKAAP